MLGTNLYNNGLLNGGNTMQAFIRSLGLDPRGNNEIGALFRRGGFGLAPSFLSRIGFRNELEPGRQRMLMDAINAFGSQGGLAQLSKQRRSANMADASGQGAMDAARVRGFGGSAEAQSGALLAARNRGTQASNDFTNQLYGAEGTRQRMGLLGGLYDQGQDLGLNELMQMFGAVEGRSQANAADRARGGLGGLLGGLGGPLGQWVGGQMFPRPRMGLGNNAWMGNLGLLGRR